MRPTQREERTRIQDRRDQVGLCIRVRSSRCRRRRDVDRRAIEAQPSSSLRLCALRQASRSGSFTCAPESWVSRRNRVAGYLTGGSAAGAGGARWRAGQRRPGTGATALRDDPQDRQALQAKLDELDPLVRALKAKRGEDDLMADVEIHAKAGHWLLEFPQDVTVQDDVTFALKMLDRGIERAKQLQNGQSPWTSQKGKVALGFYSPLDGSVQPLLLTIPAGYDGKPTRLDIVLHGRSQRLIESNWICYDPSPANAQTGERLLTHAGGIVPPADAQSLGDRRLERRAVSARSVRARQQRQSLGRRGRRLRIDGRRAAPLQDRRFAARAARIFARRSRRVASCAASSGSLGGGGNRRRHVAATLPDDERLSGASAADAAHLGEHDRVGAECVQHSDRRTRRRQRHAGGVDSASARRRADARPARVVDQNSGTARERRLSL